MNKEFSIDEKMKLLAGKNGWQLEDLNGKLYKVSVSDGPLGVRKTATEEWGGNVFKLRDLPSVAYPSMEVLSQTWNLELAYRLGECIADDCIEKNVDVLLGPGINIKRSPVCGRNFEYVSEDPLLAGVFAREYIRGLQDCHVGATLKHYLANNNEIGRLCASSNIDERTLREIYMRGFEIAVEAHPWAIMCSYNLLNGVIVSEDKESFRVLREDLGFGNGLIMSDWGAVRDHAASVRAGCDVEMPFNEEDLSQLKAAYAHGELQEAEIDVCAQRVIDFIEKVGDESKKRNRKYDLQFRRDISQKVAEEGIVLLKNNGVLPIRNGQSVSASVQEYDRYYAGGGSARVEPEKELLPLSQCLQNNLPNSRVLNAKMRWTDYEAFFKNADKSNVAVVCCGVQAAEGFDRTTLKLQGTEDEEWVIKTLAKHNPNLVVVMYAGGVVDVSAWIDDVAALVYVGYAGECGSEAIANILTGKANPSGKLTETFAKTREDYPSENIPFDGFNYNYFEKLEVGYRYFDKHPEKIRFPFGYGLSYTQFVYFDIQTKIQERKCSVEFSIENVGDFDGAEVAQVYVRPIDSAVEKPIKSLSGFSKVFLKKGEKKRIRVELDDKAFSHYDIAEKRWVIDFGEYEICVAKHSQSIKLAAKILLNC